MADKAVRAFAENGGSTYVLNRKPDGTYERKKISGDMSEIGGSELPEVSSADAGKVLVVDSDGNWSAGDVAFPVITFDSQTGVLDIADPEGSGT